MSRDAYSASKSGPEASGSRGADEKDAQGSKSYEEFTAGLEEDDEEISFLPPYASNSVDTKSSPASPKPEDKRVDSLLAGDLAEPEPQSGKMPASRRFALGTVAIIRRLLEPEDVERILVEQRRYPRLRFGDVAVQLGLLSEDEVQELLVAQEQGIFSDEEISDARRRLAAYHSGA